MSLVYLVTSLPRMHLGEPPPLTREELVKRCRAHLEGQDRQELELVLLLEEIEETCRLVATAQSEKRELSSGELTGILRTKRRPTADGPTASELPDWVMMPLPQHVLYRRWLHLLYERAHSDFLKSYAAFSVDLKEVLTTLIAAREDMTKAQFLKQMEGHFDSASQVMIAHFEQSDVGVEHRFPWFARVKTALDLDDLVEMERALNRLRWEQYERMKGAVLFSIDNVLANYFQLRILEREASWDRVEGERLLEAALALPHGLGMEQSL